MVFLTYKLISILNAYHVQLACLYPMDTVVNKIGVTTCLHPNGQKQTIIMLNSMLDYGEKRGKVINAGKRWEGVCNFY